MKHCKRLLLWLWMLTKRLYRKPLFLIVLALIPLLTVAYGTTDLSNTGLLTVALTQEGDDPMATQLLDKLYGESDLIRYIRCADPEEARALLEAGKADAAWIFPDDLQAHMDRFGREPTAKNAFVTVLERQTNVATRLSREILSGALYAGVSRSYYLEFVRTNVPELDNLSDQQLLTYYDSVAGPEQLFIFTDLTGELMDGEGSGHFLLAPVRGLLAVVVVLCALSTGMYYIQDRRKGTFGWVPQRKQPLVELGCQLVSVLQVSLMASFALSFLGLTADWGQELLTAVFYALCCASFGMVIRRACGSVGVIGVVLPLLIMAMILICPVFLDMESLHPYHFLLPPTYYIYAMANGSYLWQMLLYTGGLWLVYWLLGFLRRE